MADTDISLYYNTHRLDAMTRVLAEQGLTIEQALYSALDKLYEDLVPAGERERIDDRISAEDTQRAIEREAARRFSVVHLHDGDSDMHFISEVHTNFYNAARLYRMVTKDLVSSAPVINRLSLAFMSHQPIDPVAFSALCETMPNDPRITAILEFDFDDGTVGVCESSDNAWWYYNLKDVSTAVYKAERKKGLRWNEEQEIFAKALNGKEINVYCDETPDEDASPVIKM